VSKQRDDIDHSVDAKYILRSRYADLTFFTTTPPSLQDANAGIAARRPRGRRPAMERRMLGAKVYSTFVHGKYMACALFRSSHESEQAFADDTMCCEAYLEIVPECTLLCGRDL
jgi:hypothetical protein